MKKRSDSKKSDRFLLWNRYCCDTGSIIQILLLQKRRIPPVPYLLLVPLRPTADTLPLLDQIPFPVPGWKSSDTQQLLPAAECCQLCMHAATWSDTGTAAATNNPATAENPKLFLHTAIRQKPIRFAESADK